MTTHEENQLSNAKRLCKSLSQQQAGNPSAQELEKSASTRMMRAAEEAALLPRWCPRSCSNAEDVFRCVVEDRCFIECLDPGDGIVLVK